MHYISRMVNYLEGSLVGRFVKALEENANFVDMRMEVKVLDGFGIYERKVSHSVWGM